MILLVGAITLAAATALVARALMRPPPPVTIIKEVEAPAAPNQRVLTSSRTLVPGDFIDGAALSWQELSSDAVRVDHLTAIGESARRQLERELYGATLRRPVAAGVPLTRDALVYAGEPGFLAAVLTPGMRAVSIPTNVVASNAGLVNAGDRVDVILSLNRDALSPPTDTPNSTYAALAAQTIVHDVRVLALNSSTASIAPTANDSSEDQPANGRSGNRANASTRASYESITLEVTPAAAEQLALAREVGALQVALRSVRDHDDAASADPSALAELARSSREVTRIGDTTSIFNGITNHTQRPITVKTYQGAQQGQQIFGDAP
ncbi:Flp pilus assembly protein CpaB [Corticibacter populi]|uniref:Flp pilus assembly protein CpaB n=1 Tax=Corticibacter populi TaxID=1550736 RepID=UPI0013EEAE6B|nr:Flp pilus assembly protein CpaB [Corticibacter populi]